MSSRSPAPDFIEKIPIGFARQHCLLGFESDGARMPLAMRSFADLPHADVVSRFLGRPVDPVITPASEILSAINAAYQQKTSDAQLVIGALERREVLAEVEQLQVREDLLDVSNRAPVIKLVNLILFEAVKARASDVHVQPYEDRLVVRLRVDGILYDSFDVPKGLQEEVVSRVKVMGRMNIAEKRLAQDGRAAVQVGDRAIDLRLSTLPANFGERVVIRLLDKTVRLLGLSEIGMEPDMMVAFRNLVGSEHGIILVTGPTGSGKTTTLYAALQQIDRKQRNVLTLEDPIEYSLEGISQTQVSDKKGMTFASGLRTVLRQDPDVIMVGEIRDQETAAMAIQSALTGHLVFSTLHTNDAASAVSRLLDLGIESSLLASSLAGVLAQRLVRQVCPDCATTAVPDSQDLLRLGRPIDLSMTPSMRRGTGCPSCRNTGYRGRIGLFELLLVNDEVRRQIHQRATGPEIAAAAVSSGMKTLRDDGIAKLVAGATTIDEVMRVTV